MKTYIIGVGGVGGYFGGMLAHKIGNDVTFVARGAHYSALKENGLLLKTVAGDHHVQPVQVIEKISEIEDPELVIVATKTYSTAVIAQDLAAVVTPDTIILTIQTGLENDIEIGKYVPSQHIYPGLVYIISTKTAPGIIEQTAGPCRLLFGDRHHAENPRLEAIARMMQAAGIKATAVPNIVEEMWAKLVWIVTFSGMTAICRSAIGPIVNDPYLYTVTLRLLREATAIAAAHGVRLSVNRQQQMVAKLDNYKHTGTQAKASLLQDIEYGRPIEIDTMHGMLVSYGRAGDIATPTLDLIYGALRLYSAQ